jgi:uncharacterized protein
MSRPVTPRRIRFQPGVTYFKPAGVPMQNLEEVVLKYEEVEALRLKDIESLDQALAAKKMKVSQPTFFRVISKARGKISDAVINGKAIRVEGGKYKLTK